MSLTTAIGIIPINYSNCLTSKSPNNIRPGEESIFYDDAIEIRVDRTIYFLPEVIYLIPSRKFRLIFF